MNERDTYKIVCLSEAMSPISHASRSSGNEAILARESVETPQGTVSLPFLSGNTIRHNAVRSSGFDWLVNEYGLTGNLSLKELSFLFHGGEMETGHINTKEVVNFKNFWPLGSILGCNSPYGTIPGRLQVWRGALVCEENRRLAESLLPDGTVPAKLRGSETFVSGWQYTSADPTHNRAEYLANEEQKQEDKSYAGIFAGQSCMRGSMFVHGFTLVEATPIEYGALLHSIALWQARGGRVGGGSRIGHGRLECALIGLDPLDVEAAIEAYKTYAIAKKDEAVAWLRQAFEHSKKKAEKPAKEPKKAKPKAEVQDEKEGDECSLFS